MFKHVVKYEDFNGNPKERTLYFNLSKAELLKMELASENGLQEDLQKLVDSKDRQKIMETFDRIIALSYGEKSSDGQLFVKNQDVLNSFLQSPAYDEFVFDLLTKPGTAEAFVRGITPNTDGIRKAIPDAND